MSLQELSILRNDMAATKGHGNPRWTRDETLLALDLYFDCAKRPPGKEDQRVIDLSNLLRSLPIYSKDQRKDSFRNPDGVAFKILNLHQVATGKGLKNTSKVDVDIWTEFGDAPETVKQLAKSIRSGSDELVATNATQQESPDEFREGTIITRVHQRRERDSRLRKKLLRKRKDSTGLSCDLCSCDAKNLPASLQDAMFEAHHVKPLSTYTEGVATALKDVSLLCANCHRLIHRAISQEKRWLTIEEAKELIFGR